MPLKYIRHEKIGFILWAQTDDLWHAHMARLTNSRLPGKVISAGFVDLQGGIVNCRGRSESLNLGPLPDDNEAMAKQLGLFPFDGSF
jgi:hypothetical protein